MKRAPMVEIRRTAKYAARLPFEEMARAVLPRDYQLSLVICGDVLAQRINTEWRNKTYKPNVLSFPLSAREGEIFLNVRKAEREAKMMDISADTRVAHLFIHGCAHLKGLDHGPRMDALEKQVLRRFGF